MKTNRQYTEMMHAIYLTRNARAGSINHKITLA